jgi:hypothetical protein
MTGIYEMSMNLDFAIRFAFIMLIIDSVIIILYSRIFKYPLSRYDIFQEENKKYFFWFYNLIIVSIIIYFTRDYAGIFEGFKNLFVFISILFIVICNIIIYCKERRLTRTQFGKAMSYLFIIWLISYATIYVIEDAYKPYDEYRNWDSYTFEYENNDSMKFNITAQVNTRVIAYKGFFVNTPLIVSIYEGVIKYNGENISTNDTIIMNVTLTPHQYYSENETGITHLTSLKTNFNNENKYVVNNLHEPWLISYPYSGEKYLNTEIFVNGELKGSFKKPLVTIERGYVKSQVEMTRAVIVFAMWTIFATLYRPINKILDWWFLTHPDRYRDDGINY